MHVLPLPFQKTYTLDSLIVYLSGGKSFGEGGHYMAIKQVGPRWLLLNDEHVFEIEMPRSRFHIYMAFYRADAEQSTYMHSLWENRRFKKLEMNEIHAILGVEAYSKVRGATKKPKTGRPLIKVNEGIYAKGQGNSSFSAKLANRPKLLSNKPTPTKRKRSNSENDSDYDPTADASAGSEDTQEDMAMERETVEEQPNACKTSQYSTCNLPIFINFFPHSESYPVYLRYGKAKFLQRCVYI